MARGGINKALVRKARDALLARGENPSIDAVRVELGNTGSKSTIHRYMRELEQGEASLAEGMASISNELAALVERLAGRLHEEAQTRIDQAEAAAQTAYGKLHDRYLEQEAKASGLAHELTIAQAAMAAQAEELSTCQSTLQTEQTRNARITQACADLETRLGDKQAQIDSLEEKHRHAREALEHYRAAAKEQRDQDQQRHEGQIQAAQAQLRQLEQAVMVKQDEMTQMTRTNERYLAQIEQAQAVHIEELERIVQLNAEVQRLSALHAQGEGARSVLLEQIAEAKREQAALAERLSSEGKLAVQAREQLAVLNAQVLALREQLETERTALEAHGDTRDLDA